MSLETTATLIAIGAMAYLGSLCASEGEHFMAATLNVIAGILIGLDFRKFISPQPPKAQ